jgi:hypothetical protein
MAPPKGFLPWNKGKTNIYSPEVIESNRQKHLGKKLSEEHKQKISLKMKVRKLSEDHKRKIGLNTTRCLTGKKLPSRTIEHCNNLSNSLKGRTFTKEHKDHISKTHWQLGKKGPLAINWLGGKKFEPYPWTFNKEFKQSIKERDSYACLKCNLFEEDHKKLYIGQGLHIHHIDYNKKLTVPENCCCLCNRCNSEVNFNRPHWKLFFQSILSERYNYKYDQDNNILIEVNDD